MWEIYVNFQYNAIIIAGWGDIYMKLAQILRKTMREIV